jgi:hypothetical protein
MNRSSKILAALGLTLTALAAAPIASAHHSAVMYDDKNSRVLEGTVKSFNWTNPHVTLEFLATGKPGEAPTLWTVEMTSPGVLTRAGWSKRSFNPGERVSVDVAPLKDGRPGGAYRKGTNLTTGQVYSYSLFGKASDKAGPP